MGTILVTGATGRVGSALLPRLRGMEHRVIAITRRPAALPGLRGRGAEAVVADLRQPRALCDLLAEVDAVFLSTPDAPDQDRLEAAVIAAAGTSGEPHVVKLSAQSAGLLPPRSFGVYHRRSEEALEASGLPYTILRPTLFLQSLLLFARDVARRRKLIAPAGAGRIAMVDVDDVAAAAAVALGTRDHRGRIYTLTGPAAHSFSDVASQLSDELGHRVGYVSPPPLVARVMLPIAMKMPRWQAKLVVDLFDALRTGAQEMVSGDVATLTGRPAAPLDNFVRANIAAFR
ncbi:NAD(P)H-binding protein [Nitriliruptor alkaliphilus]|uniref:NAD(P)H-binding protein n=1 Tax=Nitriliruptor alkaliphilus TaxID=427918 RepID=UPI000697FEAD|nr:NAD(P)H-binding protein [Nitriliruptor alkaliphilus]